MAKYLGSKFKITRRLGNLVGLTHLANRCTRWYKRPGQHGRFEDYYFPKKLSEYEKTLIEKQKIKRYYGLREVQLLKYVTRAYKRKAIKGRILIAELEYRLDNLLFRSGVAYSIRRARQFITHKHVLVNGKPVNLPSFSCSNSDVITFKQKPKTILWVSDAYMKDSGNPWNKRLWTLRYPSTVKHRYRPSLRMSHNRHHSKRSRWRKRHNSIGSISHKPSFLKVDVIAIPSILNQKITELYKTRKFKVDARGPLPLTQLYPVNYKRVYNTIKITVHRNLNSVQKRDVLLQLNLLKVFEFYGRKI